MQDAEGQTPSTRPRSGHHRGTKGLRHCAANDLLTCLKTGFFLHALPFLIPSQQLHSLAVHILPPTKHTTTLVRKGHFYWGGGVRQATKLKQRPCGVPYTARAHMHVKRGTQTHKHAHTHSHRHTDTQTPTLEHESASAWYVWTRRWNNAGPPDCAIMFCPTESRLRFSRIQQPYCSTVGTPSCTAITRMIGFSTPPSSSCWQCMAGVFQNNNSNSNSDDNIAAKHTHAHAHTLG